ncbi:MAG: Maf family protein [Pseudomonadota bacterium]
MQDQTLVLASASPRRRELLARIGTPYLIDPANISETPYDGETPENYVRRMANEKARVVLGRHPQAPVLAADTIVIVDGVALGKPQGRDEARGMLQALSGRTHQVISAVCLASALDETHLCVSTEVDFMSLDAAMIDAYLTTDEPWDKAGAYGIQGTAGLFVQSIRGSYSNVVGLPLHETWRLLQQRGIATRLDNAGL